MKPVSVLKILPILVIGIFMATQVQATPLNKWRVSCGVDKGAIKKTGKVWVFRTSSNKCPGGVFKQRAELETDHVKPNIKGAYLFQSKISMRSGRVEKYDIFQMHDGRRGCAPPLKVTVLKSGRLELGSDYKTGPGESCVRGKLSGTPSKGKIRRDGTEQDLQVLVVFDGKSGFTVSVWIDNVLEQTGVYQLPSNKGYFKSKFFYFKHGVYSQRMFDYELTSTNMRVRKVKIKN